MRLFQIGFNKCATSALWRVFHKSNVAALHSQGRRWRLAGHPALQDRAAQLNIRRNIDAGRPAIEGFEDFQAFFDMEYVTRSTAVENYRQFETLARDYPTAKFLLNTREKADWLRSRARHKDGRYLHWSMRRTGLSRDAVLQMWSDDFDRHHDAVRAFFRFEQDRLLEFHIDTTPIKALQRFVLPELSIWPRFWRRFRVTDDVAAREGWSDEMALLAA
ncbi:hypothetical protein P1J78_18900 [Psychromarinibacter sp. C21-152]|uniref:Sulfotransferase family protein n=1 Tax=Psychromarinibacter sediminicola TaxID=3033385 RepID=A0AAE3TB98_9RHOB|nr:sulfotransferase [Psychromarinibacter sediminicola]MDF0602814.1 hypothetical protein [Psychromarinibacter sediminicola]